MELSCILAGYNESERIEGAVKHCLQVLERDFEKFEIILIDDGSRDDTAKKMEELSRLDSRIRCLPNLINLNFGASVLRGLVAAKYKFVIYNAIDLPLAPGDYRDILREMEKYDLLVLERVGYKPSTWRVVTSNINTLLLRLLFPIVMKDNPVVNFVQVFRKDIISNIFPLARSPIFAFAEMIFRAKYLGYRVGNLKARVAGDQTRRGAFGKPHDIIWGLYDMFRFRIRVWIGEI